MLPPKFAPYAKAVLPFLGTALAVLVQWAVTGEFDRAELATALTGAVAAITAFLAPNQQQAELRPEQANMQPA